MRRIIPTIILCSFVIAIAGVLTMPSVATAVAGEQDPGKIETRLQVPIPLLTTKEGNITVTPRTLAEYIIRIYNFLLMAATVIATVMLVWGGFMWMTAGGGAERVGKAQEYIWNAIAGLVILFGAYLILSIVNPDLTTLKSLKINPIKPIAQGFFCDERIQNLQKIYVQKKNALPEALFIPIQTRSDTTAKNPKDVGTRVNDAQKTRCGEVYAIERIERSSSGVTKAIEPNPCMGRSCDQQMRVCDPGHYGPGRPGCTLGAFAGRVIFPEENGVDYIWIVEKDNGTEVLSRDMDPTWTTYWVPMVYQQMGKIQDDKLYYMRIEVSRSFRWEKGGGRDLLLGVGKGGKRISISEDRTQCYTVSSQATVRTSMTKTPIACKDILWTGAEIKNTQNTAFDINLLQTNGFPDFES